MDDNVAVFLNRLSDYLFTAARYTVGTASAASSQEVKQVLNAALSGAECSFAHCFLQAMQQGEAETIYKKTQ